MKPLLNTARHGFHSFSGKSDRFEPPLIGIKNRRRSAGLSEERCRFVWVIEMVVVGEIIARNNPLMGHKSR